MHSFVISKNVKWCHLIWPTRYMATVGFKGLIYPHYFSTCVVALWLELRYDVDDHKSNAGELTDKYFKSHSLQSGIRCLALTLHLQAFIR